MTPEHAEVRSRGGLEDARCETSRPDHTGPARRRRSRRAGTGGTGGTGGPDIGRRHAGGRGIGGRGVGARPRSRATESAGGDGPTGAGQDSRPRSADLELHDGTGRLCGPPGPAAPPAGGPSPHRCLHLGLRRGAGGEHGHRVVLPAPSDAVAAQHARGLPHRRRHHRDLHDRLGAGGHRRLRLRRPREHRPERVPHVAPGHPVEHRRHHHRAARHLAGLGAVVPQSGQGRDPGHHGDLRPHLRGPHGRGHQCPERAGRNLAAYERGALPVARPEFLRHHPGARPRRRHPLCQSRHPVAARPGALRAHRP